MCREHYPAPFQDNLEDYLERIFKSKTDPLIVEQLKLNKKFAEAHMESLQRLGNLEKRLGLIEAAGFGKEQKVGVIACQCQC